MEEDSEAEEGGTKMEKLIRWTQLNDGRPTEAVIGEIRRAQETINSIRMMDRKDK